jgi:hypothetical protein
MSVKISQLTAATTPLVGQELVVMNQNNATVTTPLSNVGSYIGTTSNYATKISNNNFTTSQTIFGSLSCSSIQLSGSALTFKKGVGVNSVGVIPNSYVLSGNNVNAFGGGSADTNSGNNVNALGNTAATNNSGSDVNALGDTSGSSNSGSNVNAFGAGAAVDNSGSDVNALGNGAADTNSGQYVNALGSASATANSGNNVNAFGNGSGSYNAGQHVNALGASACLQNTGSNINAFGYSACDNNSGDGVNALGNGSCYNNTGSYVNALGNGSGINNSGGYNQFFGSNTSTSPTSLSGCLVVGHGASATQNNTIALGSTTVPFLTSGSGTNTGNFLVMRLNGQNVKIPIYI